MRKLVEDVFVTEGVPNETFVKPPNYHDIFVDIRRPGKPVVIEGQSGTGKTTTVKKIQSALDEALVPTYLSGRKPRHVETITKLSEGTELGSFIIDDFHRLSPELQTKLADLAKLAAEEWDAEQYPKLILIGINEVGSTLIQFVPDIAKRVGIHKIAPANQELFDQLIERGASALNVRFGNPQLIFEESRGDYWLTQQLCQTACTAAGVLEESADLIEVAIDIPTIRRVVVEKLRAAYYPAVKEFCRGRRFRPSNDPYFKVLKAVAETGDPVVDLTMLANANVEVRGSINNIKDARLTNVLESKELAARYFFYSPETTTFAVEDPAVFYFLRHLDWEALRTDCGFRGREEEHEFDIAISFAGENRALAKHLAEQFIALDYQVFYDENFEANYLGTAWSKQFTRIFGEASRYVLCLLDEHHQAKIWPTFEREVFVPRIQKGEVIPVYLDDTPIVGIPKDIVGIQFKDQQEGWQERADQEIVFKVIDKLD
ncbi:TIR domain-containing protein [Pseudoxanthomonas winnipegensis]|uniref:TIR domain-containing protein n=1 Tax=Pseudoxanthomonas winnipegensis TaxID=2480810 RepID=A0A4V2HE78_9GAMM|nr:TIR domain-containing protein [Pseudoxanthomonas winnipegensis]RZZ85027.1 TIR domain-containing protein [Pseudoxanthomonas winnipegensis]TAA31103.1 TIR domain-containing protein [Pseudoxanthomonas winnipegensis]TAA38586.1 TIR domain-containing protein [Pseudoxanthomonas winnipegensis]TBV77620.1 TIR domain-containing protein [Pseudoxanthomonas winnipegensis]